MRNIIKQEMNANKHEYFAKYESKKVRRKKMRRWEVKKVGMS